MFAEDSKYDVRSHFHTLLVQADHVLEEVVDRFE